MLISGAVVEMCLVAVRGHEYVKEKTPTRSTLASILHFSGRMISSKTNETPPKD